MLLQFIKNRLDQLNKEHSKTTVNSEIQCFAGCSQKKYLLKVSRFLVHPPQNGGPVKFLRVKGKPSFTGQYFQTSRISDIRFNENASYVQNLICQQHIQFVKKVGLRLTGC